MKYAYWLSWRKDVEICLGRCDVCCRNRNGQRNGQRFRQGLLQNAPGLTVMQKFPIDLTGSHVRSRNGFTYLLTGICYFSKYLVAVPLRDKSSLSVARTLVKHRNRNREFINEVLDNVHRLMGVQGARTTSYRPSSNGVVERVHATINHVFAKTVTESQTNWCEMTLFVVSAYNCAYHVGTTFSPFFVLFLREPRVSLDLALNRGDCNQHYADIDLYTDVVKQRMERAYGIVAESTLVQFDRMNKHYDCRVKETRFSEGQFVWFYSPQTEKRRGSRWLNQST